MQAEDGIRDSSTSRGLGDVYKRQVGVDVLGDFVEVINQPNLEATKIASIDSFATMPKAITFPKLEPLLVWDVSAEVM